MRAPRGTRNAARGGARRRTSALASPIGRDFKRVRAPRSPLALLPAVLTAVACAFALTSLRTQVLKLRYELAEHVERERELRAEQSDLTVEMRKQRSPRELVERAAALGFARPERVIDLPSASGDDAPPAVAAAGPPERGDADGDADGSRVPAIVAADAGDALLAAAPVQSTAGGAAAAISAIGVAAATAADAPR